MNEVKQITQTEIADRMKLPQGSVSRHLAKLTIRRTINPESKSLAYLEYGLGYCECRPDPYEPRKLAVYLTKKGKEFFMVLCYLPAKSYVLLIMTYI